MYNELVFQNVHGIHLGMSHLPFRFCHVPCHQSPISGCLEIQFLVSIGAGEQITQLLAGFPHGKTQLAFKRYPVRGWKIWKAPEGPETASPKNKSLWMISMSNPLWCCLFFSTNHQNFKQIGWFCPWIPWTYTSDQDRLKPCLWKGKKNDPNGGWWPFD